MFKTNTTDNQTHKQPLEKTRGRIWVQRARIVFQPTTLKTDFHVRILDRNYRM
jgi:hypothetical protein